MQKNCNYTAVLFILLLIIVLNFKLDFHLGQENLLRASGAYPIKHYFLEGGDTQGYLVMILVKYTLKQCLPNFFVLRIPLLS